MRTLALLAALAALPDSPAAQAASGRTHFLVAGEQAGGGRAGSLRYALAGAAGAGAVASRAASFRYRLLGGFAAALDAPARGRPWLTGVTPRFVTLRGGGTLTVHGTELDLGLGATLTVGGKQAAIARRRREAVVARMPAQETPGYRPVVLTNGGGAGTLPRGVGVLPLIETPRAPRSMVPFELVFRGRRGDTMVWAFADRRSPLPLRLPGFGYALWLDLGSLVVSEAHTVGDAAGVLRVPIPAVQLGAPVFVQAFTISRDAGYAPGAFTNVVEI